MCSECLKTPCDPRCPNAPDPKGVEDCVRCKHPILPGEEYAKIDGLCYCESCIDDMPYCELIPLLGGEWLQAHEEDLEDGSDWDD